MAGEAATDGGHAEDVAHESGSCRHTVEHRLARGEERLDHLVDVVGEVALEVEADVVSLQDDVCGVAGESDGVDERRLAFAAGPGRPRKVLVHDRVRQVAAEIRQPPRHLGEDPRRGEWVELVDLRQGELEALAGSLQCSAVARWNGETGGDHGVPERDDRDRHPLVAAAGGAWCHVELLGHPGQLVLRLWPLVGIAGRVVHHPCPVEGLDALLCYGHRALLVLASLRTISSYN